MRQRRILVTGAAGFIGTALGARLRAEQAFVTGLSRLPAPHCTAVGTMDTTGDWSGWLRGVDTVVHLAGRAHVMRETAADPLQAYRRVNVDLTMHLARRAAAHGVRRFVFLSSIKVNGEATRPGRPFRAGDPPAPVGPYAVSRREAEDALLALAAQTSLEVVVIRPPLVYGPGVRANFRALMNALARGLPLPLGAIDNRRTLVGLDNLVDLIVAAIRQPRAANRILFAGDGEDLSTRALVRRLAGAMQVRARLVPVPVPLLRLAGRLGGRGEAVRRLCDSLQVDLSDTCRVLGWTPPVSVDEGLRRTAGVDR